MRTISALLVLLLTACAAGNSNQPPPETAATSSKIEEYVPSVPDRNAGDDDQIPIASDRPPFADASIPRLNPATGKMDKCDDDRVYRYDTKECALKSLYGQACEHDGQCHGGCCLSSQCTYPQPPGSHNKCRHLRMMLEQGTPADGFLEDVDPGRRRY